MQWHNPRDAGAVGGEDDDIWGVNLSTGTQSYSPSSSGSLSGFVPAEGAIPRVVEAVVISDAEGQRETLSRIAEFGASAPATLVLVNLPAQDLTLVRDGETVLTMDTVVGSPSRPTPLLTDTITHVVVNPTWTVPPTVLKQDKLPSLRRTGRPGIDHATVWLDGEPVDPAAVDWTGVSPRRVRIVQSAGDHNALGRFRFNLTNGDHIYLHGTNAPRVFDRDRRAVSSGCVRLADPEALADDLLRSAGFTPERIASLVGTGETRWLRLAEPMPVRFVYWPAVLRNDRVVVLPDIYGIVPPPELVAAAN